MWSYVCLIFRTEKYQTRRSTPTRYHAVEDTCSGRYQRKRGCMKGRRGQSEEIADYYAHGLPCIAGNLCIAGRETDDEKTNTDDSSSHDDDAGE